MEGKTRRAVAFIVSLTVLAGGWRSLTLAQSDSPFVGVVEQDGVEVRAGAGKTFYIVGNLRQGTLVQVDEVIFGWYKIQPPSGVASYVSKAYVNARGDGKAGTVTRDRSPVRSASMAGPGDSYRKQLDLGQGDEVQILAEEGSFYKIVPPKGAYVYIEPGTLRRATAEQTAAFGAATTPTTGATTDTNTKPATDVKPTTAAKPEATQGTTRDTTQGTTPSGPANTGTGTTQKAEPAKRTEPLETEVATTDAAASVADAVASSGAAKKYEQFGPPAPQETRPQQGSTLAKVAGTDDAATQAATGTQVTPNAGTTVAEQTQQTQGTAGAVAPAEVQAPVAPKKIDYRTLDVAGLEQQLVLTANLPLEQRPVEEMLAAYRARLTDQTITVYDQRLITFRLKQLERTAQAKDAIVKINEARAQLTTSEQGAAVTVIKEAEARGATPAYVAFGRLTASSVYNGESLPRLYRVVEPHTFRTVAYVRPGGGVGPDRLGSVVGIVGTSAMDPALQIEVVTPSRVDLLEAVTDARPAATE